MLPRFGPKEWSPRAQKGPIWPEFVDAYLEAALWASNDEEGRPLDEHYSGEDFAPEAIAQAINESNDFVEVMRKDLESVGSPPQHGHDFWLTRNHHGAGFWDRGYDKDIGDRLTGAAQAYGEVNVYVGDDDMLYFSPG
jgi:hypothetical protein